MYGGAFLIRKHVFADCLIGRILETERPIPGLNPQGFLNYIEGVSKRF